jgi:hypothetical protein
MRDYDLRVKVVDDLPFERVLVAGARSRSRYDKKVLVVDEPPFDMRVKIVDDPPYSLVVYVVNREALPQLNKFKVCPSCGNQLNPVETELMGRCVFCGHLFIP